MWFNLMFDNEQDAFAQDKKSSWIVYLLTLCFLCFLAWASVFEVEQVARAHGEVIASSRVQVIQSVDGGILESLAVREGDTVAAGQVLARLDQSRFGAAVEEIEARLAALRAKAQRLRAEVVQLDVVSFSEPLVERYPSFVALENALFLQRREGLQASLEVARRGASLAQEELSMVMALAASNDANKSEVIAAKKALNEHRGKEIELQKQFFESARAELALAEDHIAQNAQILKQRNSQLQESVLVAKSAGIVKNIRVTTVGGVLRAGEELMQIIPLDDVLIVEAKASPSDIAQLQKGLTASIRLDPYDYTIFGAVEGEVQYVSADTLKEETGRGEEIYYRVHVSPLHSPVTTTIGRAVEMVPGMTGQVDIRTGSRSVLDYLLKPIRKTLSESFGEQ
ncbi:MAG: HlyD family efflux transporter periplasmic adaptor subunit [Pseudomonadota bacterium]